MPPLPRFLLLFRLLLRPPRCCSLVIAPSPHHRSCHWLKRPWGLFPYPLTCRSILPLPLHLLRSIPPDERGGFCQRGFPMSFLRMPPCYSHTRGFRPTNGALRPIRSKPDERSSLPPHLSSAGLTTTTSRQRKYAAHREEGTGARGHHFEVYRPPPGGSIYFWRGGRLSKHYCE